MGLVRSLVCVSFSLFLQFVLPLILRPEQTVLCCHVSLLVLSTMEISVYQVYMIDITTCSNGVAVAAML